MNVLRKNAAAAFFFVFLATTASAATITVNSAGDVTANDGKCTLREAIVAAQTNSSSGAMAGECAAGAAAPDVIAFAIGSGPKTIKPASVLPDLASDVTLDATTQPGFSGKPLIELSGSLGGVNHGFSIFGDNVSIKGFAVNDFDGAGIIVQSGAEGFKIQGNYVGTDLAGVSALGNGASGIDCTGANGLIGGSAPGEGNLISGNAGNGVFLYGAGTSGNVVAGNLIGTDANGGAAIPNLTGVEINNGAHDNRIGGDSAAEGNLISGNTGHGIEIQSASTADNQIQGNIIAFNGADGVAVAASGGSGNSILGNSIFENTGLGIDLSNNGVTANDASDADTGPNHLQNFPVISSAVSEAGTTTVTGTLNSVAGADYTLEFFANDEADASGNGEGRTFLGRIAFNTGAGGDQAFSAALSAALTADQFVTATATSQDGSTSEFSANFPVTFIAPPDGGATGGTTGGSDGEGTASGSTGASGGTAGDSAGSVGGCSLIRSFSFENHGKKF